MSKTRSEMFLELCDILGDYYIEPRKFRLDDNRPLIDRLLDLFSDGEQSVDEGKRRR